MVKGFCSKEEVWGRSGLTSLGEEDCPEILLQWLRVYMSTARGGWNGGCAVTGPARQYPVFATCFSRAPRCWDGPERQACLLLFADADAFLRASAPVVF